MKICVLELQMYLLDVQEFKGVSFPLCETFDEMKEAFQHLPVPDCGLSCSAAILAIRCEATTFYKKNETALIFSVEFGVVFWCKLYCLCSHFCSSRFNRYFWVNTRSLISFTNRTSIFICIINYIWLMKIFVLEYLIHIFQCRLTGNRNLR